MKKKKKQTDLDKFTYLVVLDDSGRFTFCGHFERTWTRFPCVVPKNRMTSTSKGSVAIILIVSWTGAGQLNLNFKLKYAHLTSLKPVHDQLNTSNVGIGRRTASQYRETKTPESQTDEKYTETNPDRMWKNCSCRLSIGRHSEPAPGRKNKIFTC